MCECACFSYEIKTSQVESKTNKRILENSLAIKLDALGPFSICPWLLGALGENENHPGP